MAYSYIPWIKPGYLMCVLLTGILKKQLAVDVVLIPPQAGQSISTNHNN